MSSTAPAYYEIEQLRVRSNRFLWGVIALLGLTSILSLLLCITQAARPAAVVEFDCSGAPRTFNDTFRPAMSTSRTRLEFFIEEFLKRMVLIDSSGNKLETRLSEALAMMTPRFSEITMRDGHEIERRVQYKDGNVYSEFQNLELLVGDFEPTDEKIYFYWLAKNVFSPLRGEVAPDDDLLSRWLIGRGEVVRIPVTSRNPYGLQMGYFQYDIYTDHHAFELAVLKLKKE